MPRKTCKDGFKPRAKGGQCSAPSYASGFSKRSFSAGEGPGRRCPDARRWGLRGRCWEVHSSAAPNPSIRAPQKDTYSQNEPRRDLDGVIKGTREPPTLRSGGVKFLRKHWPERENMGPKGDLSKGEPFFSTPGCFGHHCQPSLPNLSKANIWTAAGRGAVYQRRAPPASC